MSEQSLNVLKPIKTCQKVHISTSLKLRCTVTERLLMNHERHRDSWPPGKNSVQGQRQGLITQSFCVIKFYQSIKEIEKGSEIDIRRGQKECPLLVFSWMLYSY